jgi:signal transduction histidine kinase/ActR/RegA family two-component response regulator
LISTNPLRLEDSRILVEQLRLLLGTVGTSLIPTVLLSTALVWFLHSDDNLPVLLLWALGVIGSKLLNTYHARRSLHKGLALQGTQSLVWTLMLLNAVDGVLWGSLTWISLREGSVVGIVMVLTVMAGVTSNAMSVLASVLPVLLAFCLSAVVMVSSKLMLTNDPEYQTLALVTILYVTTHVAQGRIASNAARAAINLRFENLELIERLRKETERARIARQQADEANLAKSKFLAAASHDLRQPIHALGLFLEVIGRGELNAVQREMLGNARSASSASADMLNTLLDFSRIEAGVIEPKLQPVSLQDLLTKIENEQAPQAIGNGLFYRTRETNLIAMADPVLLELIVRNLVSNAIRYTRQGGVLVGCRQRSDSAWLEVWDTGIGIAPRDRKEIFREFQQLGNPERDRNKGLGLGLAIVDRLVGQLGLTLELKSVTGRGSLFRLKLPLCNRAAVAAEPRPFHLTTKPLTLQVLVVDDDQAIRLGMAQLLRDWGCDCVAVDDIEEALEAARLRPPDLFISDYRLRSQRTGAQAIVALRAQVGQQLPALLITGDTAAERLREAQATGVPLLHKPVSPSQLYQYLYQVDLALKRPVSPNPGSITR